MKYPFALFSAAAGKGSRAAAVGCLLFLLLTGACSRKGAEPEVTIGVQSSVQTALVLLADGTGAFRERGAAVRLVSYPSGKRALEGLLRGDVELAVAAETPLAIAAPFHPELRIFATLGKSDNNICILARRDRGITRPRDLRGKRIATQRGSAVHFFLSSFLLDAGIPESEVEIVYLRAEELADAFARGQVDAISMRDPILEQAETRAGEGKSVRLCRPGLYTKTYHLVGTRQFTRRHPRLVERILRALADTATLVRTRPAQARRLVARRLGLDEGRLEPIWSGIDFRLTLNQALLVSLQEELRWAVAEGILDDSVLRPGRVPDFLSLLDPAPLQRVLPEAVGLIGLEEEGR